MNKWNEMYWARWLFLPSTLIVTIILVPYGIAVLYDGLSLDSLCSYSNWNSFWFGFISLSLCTAAWILITYALVPEGKVYCAALSILPGTWLTIFVMGDSYLADTSWQIYFKTHIPLLFSLWVALATIASLWLLSRRHGKKESSRTVSSKKIRCLFLSCAVVLFVFFVMPAGFVFWQFNAFCRMKTLMGEGNEKEAIRQIIRLDRNPFFPIDWTPHNAMLSIPCANSIYYKLVGCPTCRGHWHTLMLLAAQGGKYDLLEKIIELRGTVEWYDDRGTYVLYEALKSKNLSVVKLCISKGSDVNAPMQFGGSSIHCAVLAGSTPELISILLEAGANINSIDDSGETPLDWADKRNNHIIPFLISKGAHRGTNAIIRAQP